MLVLQDGLEQLERIDPEHSSTAAAVAALVEATTASVAPRARARSSRFGCRPTAMTRAAPATRAAMTALSPSVPAPNTATTAPGCTRSVFQTAPQPVTTPRPSGASTSEGTSPSTTTRLAGRANP
ncbi:MAG TPA: hypothetical protein VH141_00855 [Pseudonocardia sp.]|jgi:hypothetical protein|nr:hypothetical protein [Pseudonocardia sp.]